MNSNHQIHHRRSIRLKEYDYSQEGGYFVTICTHNRECNFGNVAEGEIKLSDVGKIVEENWKNLPAHFHNVTLDGFVVMQNHLHGIIWIQNDGRGLINQTPTDKWILMKNPRQTLGKIIRSYKAKTTKILHDSGYPEFQWQKNYYEHIIRGEKDLRNIREYIQNNPWQWYYDAENPNNIKARFV